MPDERGYHLDIIDSAESELAGEGSSASPSGRAWVGINFECCGVYSRVYRRPGADKYEGYCPKCRGRVSLRVGPNGVSARLFRATPC